MSIKLPSRALASRLRTPFSPHPDLQTVERIVDAAFWASLRREEGATPTISLAWVAPEQAGRPVLLTPPLPLQAESLARLAPAVERPGIHLGVWHEGDRLHVWGATRTLPAGCFVLEVLAPGMLVVKRPGESGDRKYVNVAVLEGDQVKILRTEGTSAPDSPPIIHTLLNRGDEPSVLVELAVSMRQHQRGGALLVTPAGSEAWRESIVQPISYQIQPSNLETLPVETIAGLTAVDGATIISTDYELLAFGAKISRRPGFPRVEQVATSEPIEDGEVQVAHPTQLGGTRHLSAAQFAQDQRDAVALVASQDGRFTVFAWSSDLDMVHAYRVETFLV